MRADAPAAEFVAAGLVVSSTVDVWHGGRVTALEVPVVSGRFAVQRDQDVPERLDVTVPVEWAGVVLDPGRRGAALGSDGHELAVTVRLETLDGGRSWTVPVGRFQVRKWTVADAGVRVMCHGLLQKVQDRLRAVPRSPGRVSPIAGELMREFADLGMQTRVHPSLPSRSVPADFVFGADRLASIQELVTAWPARMRVDPLGVVEFLPPLSTDVSAVAVLHDGVGGTVVGAPSEGDREGAYNHVIVRVRPEGDAPEWVHEDWVRTGRLAVDTYGWVSREVESKAIRYVAQAQSIAWQELAASQIRERTLPVEAAPDWRLEVDDAVTVRTSEGVDETGILTGVDLPLTAADGVARYDVGVID